MTDNSLKSQFQQIEDNLNGAYESNDIAKISKLLSEDWTILEPQMGIIPKDQFLQAVADGRLSHTAMKKKVIHVKLHGEIAIVANRGKNIGQYQGQPFDAEQWVTNIFKKSGTGWLCISTQEAPVRCN